jgi:hypothetical protein
VKEKPVPEPVKEQTFPPILDRLKYALGTQSEAKSNRPEIGSQTKNYEASNMVLSFARDVKVIKDKASWDAITERFRNAKDNSGKSMVEVCKAYWDRKKRGE